MVPSGDDPYNAFVSTSTLEGVEAMTSPRRGVGYLAVVILVLDLVISGVVLFVLRDTWQYWLFATTLLGSIATLTVILWALVAIGQLTRSTLRHTGFDS